jgi:hypothetical protein
VSVCFQVMTSTVLDLTSRMRHPSSVQTCRSVTWQYTAASWQDPCFVFMGFQVQSRSAGRLIWSLQTNVRRISQIAPRLIPSKSLPIHYFTNPILQFLAVVTLRDSCEVRTECRFHFVVVTLCDSCEVRTESRFHFVVETKCDSCDVRTESRFHFVV